MHFVYDDNITVLVCPKHQRDCCVNLLCCLPQHECVQSEGDAQDGHKIACTFNLFLQNASGRLVQQIPWVTAKVSSS